MLIVITGPDSFLVRSEIDRLRALHDPDGLNTTTLDAKSVGVDEIAGALGTPGFFGGSRVIVVHDLMAKSSKGAASDDAGESDRGAKAVDWTRLFCAIQPENVAIFVDRDLHGVPAAVKRALPPDATMKECDPPRGSELIAWIKYRATDAGSKITDIDARMLAELLSPGSWTTKPSNPAYDRPPELELFANEIEKLALYAESGPIERSHITTMTAAAQQDRLFPLIDAVIAGDAPMAVRELGTVGAGEEETSRIVAQLGQQAELIAAMAAAGQADPVEAGRALGLSNPNRMLNVSKSLRRFRGKPSELLAATLAVERQFKSGVLREPIDHVYALVDRISQIAHSTRQGGT